MYGTLGKRSERQTITSLSIHPLQLRDGREGERERERGREREREGERQKERG